MSDSSEQAEGFLDDIKTELEDNGNIIMDFGSLKGEKAWRTGVILTKTDIKAEAIGSGKKVRGRRHRNWRPDLIVLDDIENDENVNTPEQRRKLKNWFDKAVSKAGDTYTDIMYIGTILHYDSLLNNVLQNPRYKTKKYRKQPIQSCGMNGRASTPIFSMRTMRRMQRPFMKHMRRRCFLELKFFGKRSCPIMT